MPSLSVLKDDELAKLGNTQWRLDFEDEDWIDYCVKVLKTISSKKYDENELKEMMKEIVKNEVMYIYFNVYVYVYVYVYVCRKLKWKYMKMMN